MMKLPFFVLLFASTFLLCESQFGINNGGNGLALLKLAAIKGLVVGSLLSSQNQGNLDPFGGQFGRRRRRRRFRNQNFGGFGFQRGLGLGGVLIRRSAEEEGWAQEDLLLRASQEDSDDCAKRLVCEIKALRVEDLSSEELLISQLFNADHLDISKLSVEFDLAAQIGQRLGTDQCSLLYKRCPHSREELLEIFSHKD